MTFLMPTWLIKFLFFLHIVLAIYSSLVLFKDKSSTFYKIVFLVLIWTVPLLGSIIYLTNKVYKNKIQVLNK